MCVGCGSQIMDQYILKVAPGLDWHANCLKCADCSAYLDESCTCFVRDGKTYCKRDYHRLFGVKCALCEKLFYKKDYIMRARDKIYHVDCFRCAECHQLLCTGDEFAVHQDGRVFCKEDYESSLIIDREGTPGYPDMAGSPSSGFSSGSAVNNNNATTPNNNNSVSSNGSSGEKKDSEGKRPSSGKFLAIAPRPETFSGVCNPAAHIVTEYTGPCSRKKQTPFPPNSAGLNPHWLPPSIRSSKGNQCDTIRPYFSDAGSNGAMPSQRHCSYSQTPVPAQVQMPGPMPCQAAGSVPPSVISSTAGPVPGLLCSSSSRSALAASMPGAIPRHMPCPAPGSFTARTPRMAMHCSAVVEPTPHRSFLSGPVPPSSTLCGPSVSMSGSSMPGCSGTTGDGRSPMLPSSMPRCVGSTSGHTTPVTPATMPQAPSTAAPFAPEVLSVPGDPQNPSSRFCVKLNLCMEYAEACKRYGVEVDNQLLFAPHLYARYFR